MIFLISSKGKNIMGNTRSKNNVDWYTFDFTHDDWWSSDNHYDFKNRPIFNKPNAIVIMQEANIGGVYQRTIYFYKNKTYINVTMDGYMADGGIKIDEDWPFNRRLEGMKSYDIVSHKSYGTYIVTNRYSNLNYMKVLTKYDTKYDDYVINN